MAFSFNPNQGGSQAGSTSGASFSVGQQSSGTGEGVPLSDAPKAPESPVLFMNRREGEGLTVNAYLQMLFALAAVISVIASITLFVYGWYLENNIESKKETMAGFEAVTKDYPFEEMKTALLRASVLDSHLKNYVSIRSPLKFLENIVEEKVYFDEFSFSKDKKLGYIANFTAVTNDYQSLIQQLEALKLTEYKKIATDPKLGKLTDEKNKGLRVQVTTPVFVQGKTAEEVVFVTTDSRKTENTTTAPSQSNPTTP